MTRAILTITGPRGPSNYCENVVVEPFLSVEKRRRHIRLTIGEQHSRTDQRAIGGYLELNEVSALSAALFGVANNIAPGLSHREVVEALTGDYQPTKFVRSVSGFCVDPKGESDQEVTLDLASMPDGLLAQISASSAPAENDIFTIYLGYPEAHQLRSFISTLHSFWTDWEREQK